MPVLLLVALSITVYLNALYNGFVYDDSGQILLNVWIRDIRHIPEIFTSDAWGFYGTQSVNYYRPMMHLIYMADYHLFGLNPWGYHLTNIVFHAAVTVLVYLLSIQFIAVPGRKSTAYDSTAPLLAAALFAVHPVHTEPVTWIAGVPEVSFSFFYLASFYIYIRFRDTGGKWLWWSVGLFFVSCLCKETALTLPLMIVCYEHLYRRSKERPVEYIKRYAPYFLAAAVYMVIRLIALGGFAPHIRHAELSGYEHVINVLPLFAKYMLKLLLPFNLNAFHVLHPIHSLLDARGLLSIAVVALFVLAAAAFRKNGTVLLALAFVVVPLLPVLYIPGLGENTFAERYLYLPSAGLAMLAGVFLGPIVENPARLWAAAVVFGLVLFAYSSWTVARNRVWHDEYSLWTDTVAKSPDASIPHMDLGVWYLTAGRLDDAEAQLKTSLKLSPGNAMAHCNLGAVYYAMGLYDKAIEEFGKAVHLDPNLTDAHYNMGRAYYRKGWKDMAMEKYEAAVRLNPYYFDAHMALGEAYLEKGLPDKALAEQKAAVRIDPRSAKAHFKLGLAYKAKGDLDTAISEYSAALHLEPSAAVYNNLGNAYAAKGLMDEAIAQYEKAVELDPDYELARRNLELAEKIRNSGTSPRPDTDVHQRD